VEDPAARSDFDQASGRDVLATLLRTLPPKERELVRRRYLDDQPMREVAHRMELSAKAAESLVYRALRRLRLVATQCGDEWEELTLWCPHCGAHRLLARLTPGNGPQWPLHVRAVCLACRLSNYDMGLPLDRHTSLEGALVGGMAGLGAEVQEVVRAQDLRCERCGTAVQRVEGDPPGRVAWRCPRCSLGGIGGVECVAATLPAWRAFRLATPRLRFGPVTEATRGGERQAVLTAWDQETGKRATVSIATSTMAVREIELPA
jgi:DNA-directed RNA polymerase subunit RPC12/RpoP